MKRTVNNKASTKKQKALKEAEIKTETANVDFSKEIKQNRQQANDLTNMLMQVLADSKANEKYLIAQTKYRTKVMELEHLRKSSRQTKDKLLNIISDLKIELMKYAPDNELFEVVDKITEITNGNNTGHKKSLKLPD